MCTSAACCSLRGLLRKHDFNPEVLGSLPYSTLELQLAHSILCKMPFQCVVWEGAQDFRTDVRLSKESMKALQNAAEIYM